MCLHQFFDKLGFRGALLVWLGIIYLMMGGNVANLLKY